MEEELLPTDKKNYCKTQSGGFFAKFKMCALDTGNVINHDNANTSTLPGRFQIPINIKQPQVQDTCHVMFKQNKCGTYGCFIGSDNKYEILQLFETSPVEFINTINKSVIDKSDFIKFLRDDKIGFKILLGEATSIVSQNEIKNFNTIKEIFKDETQKYTTYKTYPHDSNYNVGSACFILSNVKFIISRTNSDGKYFTNPDIHLYNCLIILQEACQTDLYRYLYIDKNKFTFRDLMKLDTYSRTFLSKIHEAGYVHRDIKELNIVVCGSDSEKQFKIIDFGLMLNINTLTRDIIYYLKFNPSTRIISNRVTSALITSDILHMYLGTPGYIMYNDIMTLYIIMFLNPMGAVNYHIPIDNRNKIYSMLDLFKNPQTRNRYALMLDYDKTNEYKKYRVNYSHKTELFEKYQIISYKDYINSGITLNEDFIKYTNGEIIKVIFKKNDEYAYGEVIHNLVLGAIKNNLGIERDTSTNIDLFNSFFHGKFIDEKTKGDIAFMYTKYCIDLQLPNYKKMFMYNRISNRYDYKYDYIMKLEDNESLKNIYNRLKISKRLTPLSSLEYKIPSRGGSNYKKTNEHVFIGKSKRYIYIDENHKHFIKINNAFISLKAARKNYNIT